MVEGFSRKLLFAFKVPVDSAFFQARGLHEVGQSSALIAFLVED
jgi:hypothetical protein